MDIKVDINADYRQTTITIQTPSWTQQIESLMNQLQHKKPKKLAGTHNDQTVMLDPDEIDYVYAEARKVYAVRKDDTFHLNMKLYDAETLLQPYRFTRFSKSVVGNVDRIERFELSFNGNLCVFFKSGQKEYVSRKYVKEIKSLIMMEVDET